MKFERPVFGVEKTTYGSNELLMDITRKLSKIIETRWFRALGLLVLYSLLLSISLWLAYQLRFDFFVDGSASERIYQDSIAKVALWVIPLKLLVLFPFRQYSGLLSYFGTPDLFRILRATLISSAMIGLIRLQSSDILVPPRGVILIDFLLSVGALANFRMVCRVVRESITNSDGRGERSDMARVVIIGAGDEGADLAKEFLNKKGFGRIPVAFLDDDTAKHQTRIHNVPVVGHTNLLEDLKGKLLVDEAVIAMPTAPARRISEIVRKLQQLHLNFYTIPSLNQITNGQVKASQIRSVEIQDLLGRAVVSIERESISELVGFRVVMVTGAGGSIGSELCRQLAGFNPERILLVEQSEYLLFTIEQELVEKGYGGTVVPLIANILDQPRMEEIFEKFNPEIVYHAAALKHVPMMEIQPKEAVKVNFLGTVGLAKLAVRFKIEYFVMISTDKAVNPTSVMGATKRLSEMYIQALSLSGDMEIPKFMAVRFGNVLGSSGSVIPTFRRQISTGGPVKVTHPDVTRYFMTIPEAVGLVLQCATQGMGGDIFVLDMGKPIKIVDLARQMIELSGLKPHEDIEIEFVGLRPGEKLFEELQHSGENLNDTVHPKIMRFLSEPRKLTDLEEIVQSWREEIQDLERSEVKSRLKKFVPDYKPFVV